MNIRNKGGIYERIQSQTERIEKKEKRQKSSNTLTDAIRARKASIEMNKLQVEKKVKNDVSSILISIIDAVLVESKNKKNREAVKRHKEPKG